MTSEEKIKFYEAALLYITKRMGPFSMDPHEHAKNCVDCMAKTAEEALSGVKGEWFYDDHDDRPDIEHQIAQAEGE